MFMQKVSWERTYKLQFKKKIEESCFVGKKTECSLVFLRGCLLCKKRKGSFELKFKNTAHQSRASMVAGVVPSCDDVSADQEAEKGK